MVEINQSNPTGQTENETMSLNIDFLEPFLEEELISDVKQQKDEIKMNLDLIEEEFEIIFQKKGILFFCLHQDNKQEIQATNFEEAILITLTRYSGVRDENIAKYAEGTPNESDSQKDFTPTQQLQSFPDEDEEQVIYLESDSLMDENYIQSSDGLVDIPQKEFEEHKKQLENDIKLAIDYLGKSISIELILLPTYSYLIRIGITMGWLNEWNADALCIDRGRRLVIELEMEWNYLSSSKEPKFSKYGIYQTKDKDLSASEIKDKFGDFGVLNWFLKNRLSTCLRKNWILKKELLKKLESFPNVLDLTVEEEITEKDSTNVLEVFNQHIKVDGDENLFLKGNLMVGIVTFLKNKISKCSNNCVICDIPLGYSGLKPTVCDSILCNHSLEQYGLGIDLMSEVKNHPEIVNLLVSLTFSAAGLAESTNGVRDMSPSPKNIENGKYNFKGDDTEIARKAKQVINTIPTIKSLGNLKNGQKLKENLEKCDPLAYQMFRWILSSNRAHFAKVLDKDKISGLSSDIVQYIMVSGNPEAEMKFRQKRKKFGSFYAFHGSNSGNWHCILRSGLKNYSNTNKMSAGAAAGPGIYLAKALATSLGYMGSNNMNWKNSQTKGVMCMALCEVINDSSGHKVFDWGYTVQDEELVSTRYLLVWEKGNPNYGNSQVLADKLVLPKMLYRD